MGKSAYEKMFEDGSAYKPIKINQPTPDNEAGGMPTISDDENNNLFEQHMDTSMDEHIEKAKRLKEMKTGKSIDTDITPVVGSVIPVISQVQPQNESKKVKELERRISMLEQALQLVMETQTKILKESK